MDRAKARKQARYKRQRRVKRNIRGTGAKPRLCVFRSLKYTYAQMISDENGVVLCSASSQNECSGEVSPSSVEGAKAVGKKMAELAQEKNVSEAVFDRNGYLYHGRVAAVAKGAREGGLKF